MSTRKFILQAVDGYLRQTGMSERQFSMAAVRDPKFVRRLRGDYGVTLTTIERAEAFIRQHPDGCAEKGPSA
ncbi:hypothetical protein [Oceanibacterium hippocampi]|uniref:Uncharacterized protein n=1 Tax=Oceanibacterium hippocampi TaxID=745714 RepID=A0A1Y5U2B9_9PROT|nr:hypothetical protein [Oceanibacterium hippocampi]SLN77264.1 hypothetical protein OCH7691_04357 [Oceanibacterium hippocampi]